METADLEDLSLELLLIAVLTKRRNVCRLPVRAAAR